MRQHSKFNKLKGNRTCNRGKIKCSTWWEDKLNLRPRNQDLICRNTRNYHWGKITTPKTHMISLLWILIQAAGQIWNISRYWDRGTTKCAKVITIELAHRSCHRGCFKVTSRIISECWRQIYKQHSSIYPRTSITIIIVNDRWQEIATPAKPWKPKDW